MSQSKRRVGIHQGSPYSMESEFMGSPTIPVLPSHEVGMQTREYSPRIVGSEPKLDLSSAASLSLTLLDDARWQLEQIRQEAKEAWTLDNKIDPVPDSAYDDADLLLERLFLAEIPMPEIGWAEDGSLGFEWRPGDGIATMGIYGDNLVIYGAFFDDKRQVEGICALSDPAMLSGFLTTLLNLLLKD